MATDRVMQRLSQAHALLAQGDLPAAKVQFEHICEFDPGHCHSWKMRGALSAQMGSIGEAVACLRRVVALEPGLAEGYYNLGNMLKMHDAPDEALAYFQKAVELSPEYAEAHAHLGAVLHSQNRLPEARQSYERALSLNANQPEIHYNLGVLQQECGELKLAQSSLENALRLRPDHMQAYFSLGGLFRSQGQAGKAASVYLQAAKVSPGSAKAHFNLGIALQELGRLEDAVSSFNSALRCEPDYADAYAGLALAQRILGRQQEAVCNYEQALRIRPGDEELRYLLAAVSAEDAPPAPPDGYVTKLFDGYADRFDTALVQGLNYRAPEQLSEAVRAVVEQPCNQYDILDLGCGTGLCGVVFRDLARSLVGVDLSPRMIDKARERGVYDKLLVNDVADELAGLVAAYDLIIAADVFIYVGELTKIFEACARALRPGGVFAFSVEAARDDESCVLQPTARYAHSVPYIRRLSDQYGFKERQLSDVVLRKDKADPVAGYIFVLGR